MSILKKVNVYRRSVTHGLTRNIGKSYSDIKLPSDADISRILIIRPNHRLGNLLMITPLIQEVNALFPNCQIDLFVKGNLAPILFENYENIDRVVRLPRKPFEDLMAYCKVWLSLRRTNYDLVINVEKNSSSGRLSTKFARSKYKLFGDPVNIIQGTELQHMAKFPVYDLRSRITQHISSAAKSDIPSLDLKLTAAELDQGLKTLNDLVKNRKRTICLFTYATGAKCYSENWWEKFYAELKDRYPEYNIIEVLPIENISKLSFKIPSFYSKDVREIASLIANTQLFIGADSGIMHLASSSGTPTVGLFCITNPEKYKPYNNNSTAINTAASDIDEWFSTLDNYLLSPAVEPKDLCFV